MLILLSALLSTLCSMFRSRAVLQNLANTRERGQHGILPSAPAGGFWGGDFSTGDVGKVQPALTISPPALLSERCSAGFRTATTPFTTIWNSRHPQWSSGGRLSADVP